MSWKEDALELLKLSNKLYTVADYDAFFVKMNEISSGLSPEEVSGVLKILTQEVD